MTKRTVSMRIIALGISTSLVASGWSLAVTVLTSITPAVGMRNTMVRVSDIGSGTVIDVKPAASGPGGWICVLTADHVISPAMPHFVSFGNAGGGGASYAAMVMRGPLNADTSRVDLGLAAAWVADLSTLPAMTLPTLGAVTNGDTAFMSGYGETATLDGINRRYIRDGLATYGTLNASFNGVDAQPVHSVGIYTHNALRYSTLFGPPGPGPAIQAEAHLLPGDSGGGSWTTADSGFRLVGVHSSSVFGPLFVLEGDQFYDVSVNPYIPWINSACATVPEPATMAIMAVGLVALVARRRRRD